MTHKLTDEVKQELKRKLELKGNLLEEKVNEMCERFESYEKSVRSLEDISSSSQRLADKYRGECEAYRVVIKMLQDIIHSEIPTNEKYVSLKNRILGIRL